MSKHITDYTKSQQEMLADLVLANNPEMSELVQLKPSDFTFTNPVEDNSVENTNTKATVSVSTDTVGGKADIFYRRVRLAEFPKGVPPTIPSSVAKDKVSLIAALNTHFTTALTEEDFASFEMPVFTGAYAEDLELSVSMAPDNLVYIGDVNTVIQGPDVETSVLVPVRDLNGLSFEQDENKVID